MAGHMLVFVYGTLTDPERVASVVETFEFVGDATLVGLHRVDGRYPTLAPGGHTEGRLLETPDVGALDSYEGVERGLYSRVPIPGDGTSEDEIAVYVGDPTKLDATESISWPGDGPLESRIYQYVENGMVRVRTND
nr:gamma-glutamylcyclotransferase family protein [Haladaptatus sp. W1]